ncbi:hypothetical protein LCGC14_0013580 [marine sediment metagenome]|uniref:BioF2-like acetyltransferase domain-containing protein n=2 Tax=root TaxID=1 RepID=A0A0F9Z3Y3_9ZZZZ|nr:GNAT family N-acetyltransferase [Pseudohongiella sp.]
MSRIVMRYTPDLASQYEQLLAESPIGMFNHSLRYREFLKEILPDAEDHYLCAFNNNEMVAALPVFVKKGPYGAVVNSLPFFGSHGGFIYKVPADSTAIADLLVAFNTLCADVNAFSSTVVEAALEKNEEKYEAFCANFFDERIGQITHLPNISNAECLDNELFGILHQKTRNMVRKGQKGGFSVTHDGSMSTLKTLHEIHDNNIRSIGGSPKPLNVFIAISKVFRYDEDYRIYTASKNGRIVSALLVLYFKDMVEYFTPATLEAYRSDQPLSLLIYTAMRDAILERESRHWNWGGTWLSQKGVYQFKSRWGTTDYPYRYHVQVSHTINELSIISKEVLLKGYPYFYTVPFAALDLSE